MEEEEPTQEQPTTPALPQRRILAVSTRGDDTWAVCQPILDWLIANGDEEMSAQALQTRAYWEANQQWVIDWGNKTRFFEFAESACRNLSQFRKMVETLPAETQMTVDYYIPGQEEPRQVDVVVWLALQAGERVHKQAQPTGERMVGKWRRKR